MEFIWKQTSFSINSQGRTNISFPINGKKEERILRLNIDIDIEWYGQMLYNNIFGHVPQL